MPSLFVFFNKGFALISNGDITIFPVIRVYHNLHHLFFLKSLKKPYCSRMFDMKSLRYILLCNPLISPLPQYQHDHHLRKCHIIFPQLIVDHIRKSLMDQLEFEAYGFMALISYKLSFLVIASHNHLSYSVNKKEHVARYIKYIT